MPMGYKHFFNRGTYFVLGKINDCPFSCYAKSGSQSLWLPLQLRRGIKIFHPKGFSGTLKKAHKHVMGQRQLAAVGLAPKPYYFFRVDLHLINCDDVESPWRCYAAVMERVLSGGVEQILRNLQYFGVTLTSDVENTVRNLVNCCGEDALSLFDYDVLCKYFNVTMDHAKVNFLLQKIRDRLPKGFNAGPDMLSPKNVVLDENGEVKVIDCDLCNGEF